MFTADGIFTLHESFISSSTVLTEMVRHCLSDSPPLEIRRFSTRAFEVIGHVLVGTQPGRLDGRSLYAAMQLADMLDMEEVQRTLASLATDQIEAAWKDYTTGRLGKAQLADSVCPYFLRELAIFSLNDNNHGAKAEQPDGEGPSSLPPRWEQVRSRCHPTVHHPNNPEIPNLV